MNGSEFYQAGQLAEAIDAVTDEVKKSPTDTAKRGFLSELLCFAGNWERADKQLDLLMDQSPDIGIVVAQMRHLIRAEQARQEFFRSGAVPELLSDPSPAIKLHLEASIKIREGAPAEAFALLTEAETTRPKVSGTCDGQEFDDFRDLDDLTASFFEVLTSTGKYFWIPFEKVELVEFEAYQRPRHLIWREAHMVVQGGPDGVVFLPTLYPGAATNDDPRVSLGRVTDWSDKEGEPARGVGQRMYLVGENPKPIMEITKIEFNLPEQPEDAAAESEQDNED